VWTLLALRKVPMAQSELAEVLGVSRSLISGTVADLVEQGLIAPVEDRRNAPYVANMDVWPVIKNVLRGREWMLLESTRLALEAAIEETEISLEEGQRPPFDLARMRLLLGMTELSQALLRLLFAIGVPHSSDGLDKWVHRAASLFSNFRKAR
jgi:DNA-binding transcriptional regulator GbsR (MarR family)